MSEFTPHAILSCIEGMMERSRQLGDNSISVWAIPLAALARLAVEQDARIKELERQAEYAEQVRESKDS